MDKKILSLPTGQLSVEHIPPRLVEAKQGWYFIFYQIHPETGALDRHRKSYNLGRIRSLKARRERAKELRTQIEELMKLGYPWVGGRLVYEMHRFVTLFRQNSHSEQLLDAEEKLSEVIAKVAELACKGLRKNTARTYLGRAKLLIAWLKKKEWGEWPVSNFKVKHAQAYMDDVRLRVNNNTYNNYRRELGVVFNAMVKRGYIEANPFSQIATVAKSTKLRRAFTIEEACEVWAEAYKTDYWLFMLMLLHCLELFRKTECFRLRFKSFNLSEGYIVLSEDDSKNHQEAMVAIPSDALPYFLDPRFGAWPQNYLVFGKRGKPHATLAGSENNYMDRHRDLLRRLKEEGRLDNIENLSIYSWKDFGMTMLADVLPPMKLKDHARHSTLDTTLRYYHGKNMVPEVRSASLPILSPKVEE